MKQKKLWQLTVPAGKKNSRIPEFKTFRGLLTETDVLSLLLGFLGFDRDFSQICSIS